ncbi:transcription elongation factor, mitochondrial [Aplysia californica]|uniref:Transcription elongation factor, mitochondrial n=1 Tax=Aplysia californica TaxID=6500 RepID=A0ABM0K4G5_APLCA|nr:transcription elongation factor, mitochondrial [Aplysia californica]
MQPCVSSSSIFWSRLSRLRSRCLLSLSNSTFSWPGSQQQPVVQKKSKMCRYSSRAGQVAVNLNDEEKGNVLHCLNNLTTEEMRRVFRSGKSLSATIAFEICQHREENGLFSCLEDLNKVKKVGLKTFSAVCENFRKGVDEVELQRGSLDRDLKYFSPLLSPEFVKTIDDVTCIEICIDSAYFSTVNKDLEVTDWDHLPLLGSHYQKQTAAEILEQAHDIVSCLPKSSVYVIESRVARRLTPSYMQLLLFVSRLQMAVQTLINVDLPTTGQHKLFNVKDSFTIKAFDLRVGGERVSSQHVVKCIEDGTFEENVEIEPMLWKRYHRQPTDIFKERYASCLLVSLGFCRHVLNSHKQAASHDGQMNDGDTS